MWFLFVRQFKDTRISFLLCSGLISLSAFLMVYFFPMISEFKELESFMEKMPWFIKGLIGEEFVPLATFEGFMAFKFYNSLTWILAIFAALFGANIISEDISSKRMDILLSYPIPRYHIIVARFAVFLLDLLCFGVISFISIWIGVEIAGIEANLLMAFKTIVAMLPLIAVLGSISLLLSCWIDESVKCITWSFSLVLLLSFLNVIFTMSEKIKFFKRFTPFGYFDATIIVKTNTISWFDFSFLIALFLILFGFAIFSFNKKEIYV